MRTRVVGAGVLAALIMLFVPPLRMAGPLLGGVLVGALLVRTVPIEDVSYLDVRHGVVAGSAIGLVYLVTVSGIGTSLVIHTVPYEPFLDYSVRPLQYDVVRSIERIPGIDPLTTTFSALTFALLVGGFAFGSTVVGEVIGKRLGVATSSESLPGIDPTIQTGSVVPSPDRDVIPLHGPTSYFRVGQSSGPAISATRFRTVP